MVVKVSYMVLYGPIWAYMVLLTHTHFPVFISATVVVILATLWHLVILTTLLVKSANY